MKKLVALVLASSLFGCGNPPPPEVLATRYPNFWAHLEGLQEGNMCCTIVDSIHSLTYPMMEGQSYLGETPHWNSNHGALEMVLDAPASAVPTGAASMGVFTYALNLGQDSNFALRATFQRPSPVPSGGWAFGVVARTGNLDDTPDLTKIQLSFRVRPSDVDARVLEINGADPNPDTNSDRLAHYTILNTDADYSGIADGSKPVTLTLIVNRRAGTGSAYLTVGTTDYTVGKDFALIMFAKGSGTLSATLFNTAGPVLATDTDWGKSLSAEVTDFKIWKF